jgi:hypothetical protein
MRVRPADPFTSQPMREREDDDFPYPKLTGETLE